MGGIKQKVNKICENCNKVFKASKPSQRFCSRECRNDNSRVTVNCAYCGKEKRIGVSRLYKNNFCDAKCRKKFEDNTRYNKIKHYIGNGYNNLEIINTQNKFFILRDRENCRRNYIEIKDV